MSASLCITQTETQMQTHLKHSMGFPSFLTDMHVSADLFELFKSRHRDKLCRLRLFTVIQDEYRVSQSASRREKENCEYLRASQSVNPETMQDAKRFLRSPPC